MLLVSRLLVARARRVLATANHWAAVEFLPGLSALEKRVCTLQLQQKHPLETPAAFILRLAVHADVNAGVLRFQYFDRNLRASLRRIEECFLFVELPRHISVVAERLFSFSLRAKRGRTRRYIHFLDHKRGYLFGRIDRVISRE